MDTGLSVTKDRDSWLEARYDSVTCTDLGKILGVDHDVSRRKLLLSKLERRDLLEGCSPITRNLIMMGQTFEGTARETFKTWYEGSGTDEMRRGFVPTMHTHTKYPWFTGSPDYLVPEKRLVVEIKTHFFPNIEVAHPILSVNDIPLKYYLQVQGYQEIMDYDDGILFSWTLKNGWKKYWVRRDKRLFEDVILPGIREFHFWMDTLKGQEGKLTDDRTFGMFKRGEKDRILGVIIQSMKNTTDEVLT